MGWSWSNNPITNTAKKAGNAIQSGWNNATSAGKSIGNFLTGYANMAFPGLNLGNNLSGLAGQAGDAFGNAMQNIGDSLGISDALSIPGVAEFNKGLSDQLNGREDETVTPTDVSDKGNEEATAVSESMSAGADTEAQEAADNAADNASAGINKSRADSLGESAASGNTQQSTASTYNAQKQQTNTTTNDYIQKMKQADALDAQAKYMKQAAPLSALSAGLGAAGTGAMMGAALSDERAKEPADGVDDNKLREAIQQFKALYKELQELKKGK